MIKNLPAKPDTQVQYLSRENPLSKELATHSSILAWEIPWTEEPGRLQSMGSHRVRHYLRRTHHHDHHQRARHGPLTLCVMLPTVRASLVLFLFNEGGQDQGRT